MSHRQISFVKSGIRIIAYVALPLSVVLAAGLLVLSELFGIYEEVGENGKTVADLHGGSTEER